MHLIYKALENNPLPVGGLPPEMISSARRGQAGGPVPAPLAPPAAGGPQQQQQQQQVRQKNAINAMLESVASVLLKGE